MGGHCIFICVLPDHLKLVTLSKTRKSDISPYVCRCSPLVQHLSTSVYVNVILNYNQNALNYAESSSHHTYHHLSLSLSDEEDAMIPLAIYNELRVQHDQLLTECFNLRTKCSALKEENEQLREALGSRFSFS